MFSKCPQYKEKRWKSEQLIPSDVMGIVDKSIKWIFRQRIRTQLERGVMAVAGQPFRCGIVQRDVVVFFLFFFFFPGSQYARPRARERVRVGDGGPRAAECGEEAHCLSLASLALSQTSSSSTAFLQTHLSELPYVSLDLASCARQRFRKLHLVRVRDRDADPDRKRHTDTQERSCRAFYNNYLEFLVLSFEVLSLRVSRIGRATEFRTAAGGRRRMGAKVQENTWIRVQLGHSSSSSSIGIVVCVCVCVCVCCLCVSIRPVFRH